MAKVEVIQKFRAELPEQVPGQHLWIVAAVFLVKHPRATRFELDHENLLTVDGPGCWWCELTLGQAGNQPCRGA